MSTRESQLRPDGMGYTPSTAAPPPAWAGEGTMRADFTSSKIVSRVDFDYAIGQRVKIKDIDIIATITGMMVEGVGHSYHVAYWNDGTRREEWMREFEIERCGSVQP